MLTYSLQHFVTIAQCEAALEDAYLEQETLLWKKMGLKLQIKRRLKAMKAAERTLDSKKADLDIARRNAAGFADQPALQKRYADAETGLDFEVALLKIRKKKLKPEWLLEKELRLQCAEASLEKISLAILELEAHKAGLQKRAAQEVAEAGPAPEAPVIIPLVKAPAVAKPVPIPHVKKWPEAMMVPAGRILSG